MWRLWRIARLRTGQNNHSETGVESEASGRNQPKIRLPGTELRRRIPQMAGSGKEAVRICIAVRRSDFPSTDAPSRQERRMDRAGGCPALLCNSSRPIGGAEKRREEA